MILPTNSFFKSLSYTSMALGLRALSLFIRTSSAWFNPFLLLAPYAGIMLGTSELIISHVLTASIWSLLVPASLISLLQLPTLAATMFAQQSLQKTFKSHCIIATFFIVGVCAFMIHPVGSAVWFYSFLWLPILGSLVIDSLFMRAWSITLSAHMVGTLLFIYTHTTTAAYWMQLMPIAFVERFCSALVLYGVMHSISFIMRYTKASQNFENVNAFISQL